MVRFGREWGLTSSGKAAGHRWTAGGDFPLLKCLNKGRVGFDAGALASEIGVCTIVSHSTITDEVREDDSSTA